MFSASPFSSSPFSAESLNNYQLVCSAGSFSISGGTATFAAGKAIPAEAGSYTITGGNASFVYNQTIYAGAFQFALNGQDAQLNVSHRLNGSAGSYQLVGGNAALSRVFHLQAQAGSFEYIGHLADFIYDNQGFFVRSGGLPKKKGKSKLETEREQREELETIVKREFDILDGTYIPEIVETVKQEILPEIKAIDWTEYQIALAQVNELILKAKIRMAEYESEIDDEESILMLL